MEQETLIIFVINAFVSATIGYGAAAYRLGRFVHKVETLEREGSDNKKEVKEIRDKVIACETSLKEREPLGKRKSPLALSERGVRFNEDSGAKKFIDDNFNELTCAVEVLDPKTAYDVQEDAKKVVETLKDDERINHLKEWLFKDGSTLEDLFFVMSIYLRDKVLIKKDWNVKDIDSHKTLQA